MVNVAAQTTTTQSATVTFKNELSFSNINIDVKKEVSVDGGTTYDDANSPTGPSVLVDDTVMFRFTVTNPNIVPVNVTLTR